MLDGNVYANYDTTLEQCVIENARDSRRNGKIYLVVLQKSLHHFSCDLFTDDPRLFYRRQFDVQSPKSAEKEKSELVAEAIAKIEKQYGKGSIIRLGDKEIEPVDVISTGCLTLDMA